MLAGDLLSMLCCPETKQALTLADAPLIEKINRRIEERALKNRGGETILQKIEGGLVRNDQRYLYPVREDIPVMLIAEAIPLAGIL